MTNEERNIAIADMRRIKNEYMNGREMDEIAKRKCKSFDIAIKALDQPQQKTGRWIAYEVQLPDRTILNYRCSVCGRKLIGYNTETLSEAPFCHCGAKMQESEEI